MPIDWTQVLSALAVGLPATIAAISALMTSLKNNRAIQENTDITRKVDNSTAHTRTESIRASSLASTAATIAQHANAKASDAQATMGRVEDRLNGKMDQLLKETEQRALAEGVAIGLRQAMDKLNGNLTELRELTHAFRNMAHVQGLGQELLSKAVEISTKAKSIQAGINAEAKCAAVDSCKNYEPKKYPNTEPESKTEQ